MGSFTPNGMPAPSPLRRSSTYKRGGVRGERGIEVVKIWAPRHPGPPQVKGARPRARPTSSARARGAAAPKAPCAGRPAILGRLQPLRAPYQRKGRGRHERGGGCGQAGGEALGQRGAGDDAACWQQSVG